MDKVFVDTNVLLDYLAARVPFDKDAKTLIQRPPLAPGYARCEIILRVLPAALA